MWYRPVVILAMDMPAELTALNITPQGALLRWNPPLSNVDNYVLTLTHNQGKLSWLINQWAGITIKTKTPPPWIRAWGSATESLRVMEESWKSHGSTIYGRSGEAHDQIWSLHPFYEDIRKDKAWADIAAVFNQGGTCVSERWKLKHRMKSQMKPGSCLLLYTFKCSHATSLCCGTCRTFLLGVWIEVDLGTASSRSAI